MATGNAVVDSPGWGLFITIVFSLRDNVVFDVVGAGISAEAGNEIGLWQNNLTIKTKGDDHIELDLHKDSPRAALFDFVSMVKVIGFRGLLKSQC